MKYINKLSIIACLISIFALINSNANAQNCTDLELLANQSTFSKNSYAITNYNGETYIGGWIEMKKIVNDTYVNIPDVSFSAGGGSIRGMKEINNRLYFWGWGIIVNGTNTNLGYYDGTNFVALPFIASSNKDIWNVIKYNNNLIAVGDFDGTPAYDLYVFNDAGIVANLGGITSTTGYSGIREVLYYNGHLFIAGIITQAAGTSVYRIAHYNGTSWDDMGVNNSNSTAQTASDFYISALFPYDNDHIIVSGYFNKIGGVTTNLIALYNFNTGVWTPFQAPAIVQDFEVYKGTLYAGTKNGIWRYNTVDAGWDEINATSMVYDMEVSSDGLFMQCVSGGSTFYYGDGTTFTGEPIKFSCESIVSIGDSEADELAISVYPNPASNHINIRGLENTQNFELEIIDVNGRVVKKFYEIPNNTSLDISSLQSGVYFLQFSNSKRIFVRRLMVSMN